MHQMWAERFRGDEAAFTKYTLAGARNELIALAFPALPGLPQRHGMERAKQDGADRTKGLGAIAICLNSTFWEVYT